MKRYFIHSRWPRAESSSWFITITDQSFGTSLTGLCAESFSLKHGMDGQLKGLNTVCSNELAMHRPCSPAMHCTAVGNTARCDGIGIRYTYTRVRERHSHDTPSIHVPEKGDTLSVCRAQPEDNRTVDADCQNI